MTTASETRVRRNMMVLVFAQMFLGSQMPVHFILGGLAGQLLSPDKCFSTAPITLIVTGTMLTAPFMSGLMQRFGRRAGFVLGAMSGAVGASLCAAGLWFGSFGLFLAGAFVTGIYMSAQGFYRFAATDGASLAMRPKVISYVMAAGLGSAIIGPQLVKLTESAMAPVPFAGAYLAVVALNLAGVFIFAFLDSPSPAPPTAQSPKARSYRELVRSPVIVVAMICGMVAYSLMNLVMTSTPLAVVGCGFATGQAADVVSAHVLAMFMPSFFTGYLINWFGVRKIIATGLFILAGAGMVGLAGVELGNFYGALILLGVGWNFGYIGATTLLTSAYRPEEMGRVQGMNDFAVFGMVALASLASGGLMNCSGGDAQTGWQAVNLAMIPLLTLAGSALIWLALGARKTA